MNIANDHTVMLALTAIYRRVSTDQQDDSLELQEKRVADYARFKGLVIGDGLTFSDPDTSGSIPMRDRNGGRALMNRLALGDVKHLVVAKLDRLGRNVRDGLAVLEFLRERDIVLHITDLGGESISTQGHIGQLILTLMFAFAEWELGEIRDRTRKQMRYKFDNRELTGNVPFGWDAEYAFADGHLHTSAIALSAAQLAPLISDHGSVVSKLLATHRAEQELIRQLAEWRKIQIIPGRPASYGQVATWANECGHRTKQGQVWQGGNVRSVLTNRHTARLLANEVQTETFLP